MVTCYCGIALSFGYVESNTTAWLIYHAERKASSTRREALQSLVAYLWDKYSKEMDEHHEFSLGYSYGNKCCQRHWSDTKYVNGERRKTNPVACPTCKMEYPVTWTYDEEKWQEYLWDLHRSDCDNYGEHDWPENPYGWSPWMYPFNIPQHQMIVVTESAEQILTEVLYELHPNLRPEQEEYERFSLGPSDYEKLMDESYVISNYDGRYIQNKPDPDGVKVTTTFEYPNGGVGIMVDNVWTYIKYNTGDEIWLDFKNGKYEVTKVRDSMGNETTEWNRNPYNQ